MKRYLRQGLGVSAFSRLTCASAIVAAVFSAITLVSAQINRLTPEELTRYSPQNPFERFPDGRPKVPDALLDEMRKMEIDVEEAWGLLREKGFPNQYEANWKVTVPEKTLVGRAFTVQFMPTRADVSEAQQKEADASGVGRLRNQTTIDMLQNGDVAVVDLFGKIEGGTFVGDKLAYYVQKTTGTGLVVDGALFYVERIAKTGMPAYYRGTHPGALTNVMLTGINVPVRIGNAVVMPGDVVLGDRDGLLFIPPQLVKEVIDSAKTQRARDEWMKRKFDTGKYKSGEIYGRPRDPELLKEFEEYMKKNAPQKPETQKPETQKPETQKPSGAKP
jgi:4-hydroxy-4-methyl-2-oxoglutarate aldolase